VAGPRHRMEAAIADRARQLLTTRGAKSRQFA
jgi:hypothetical protein